MFKFLKYGDADRIATITLNRPDIYNALNDELTFEIQDALEQASQDDSVRVVVLTGSGKAFCSGQDLKAAMAKPARSYSESVKKRYNPIIKGICEMPKPMICALNGVAAGAGCSLALACDLIIAAEEAVLIEAFVNIGLVLDSGSSYLLPRLASYVQAFEFSTMGTKIDANRALQVGLVNKVVPGSQLSQAVKEYTDFYSRAPTKAIGLIKKMLNKSYNSSLEEMLEYEAYCQDIASHTSDHTEGVRAFLEKRLPQFTGK